MSRMPAGSDDPEIQEEGRQEGAGSGGSRSRVHDVKLEINEKAKGVSLSSLKEQTPTLDRAVATASSRRSTGGNVIVVSVGPYHQLESRPSSLITLKKKEDIVNFLSEPMFGLRIDNIVEWARARGEEAKARGWCMGNMGSEEERAKMLRRDGCLVLFAVFLLRKTSVRGRAGSTDLGKHFDYLSEDILKHKKETRLDLLLLGNQIPFCVLIDLHTRLKDTLFKGVNSTLEEIALSCFDDIRPSPSTNPNPSPSTSFPEPVHHLLHLFHWSRVQPGKHDQDPSARLLGEPESNLPCATWFEDSRISFSNHAAAPDILHMDFQRNMLGMRGVLRVPALHIHGYSNLVFHNLIAFEQSHLCSSLAVTTYSICMARLLQCEADAKLLRKNRILAHTHETDEMIVRLFRELAHHFRRAYYSKDLLDLCNDVDAHHHSTAARANRFILQCFPGQTVTFFVILGAFVSIATFINAIYSVYRFSHPAKQ